MPVILLVEDEAALALIVQESLQSRGFEVRYAADGQQGLALFRAECPDIIVADVMMPHLDGFTLAQHIRRTNATVPILFLTARAQPADVVRGFAVGGQDYLKKPFSMEELIVRINARLLPAVAPPAPLGVVALGLYQFDTVRQQLAWQGQARRLTHREAALLQRLYEQRNHVLSRPAILRELWGDDSFFNGRSLDVFISRLRRYLRDDPRIQLVNVRGLGYKLVV